ncbi:MAG TPA: CaiB/BaiF CoA-transferase family protein, partial [Roseiarcus sp.]|nr:CaiB/BaiF CoA-transferase family protein [Roseiarcus sp.]
ADPNAGIHGAFAVLCALYHRAKTGEGQYLDMSQWECAMDLIPEGLLEYAMNGREPVRDGNRDAWMAPHGIFRCKDLPEKIMELTIDAWVSIACADDAEFARLADAIGRPELATDARFKTLDARKRNEDELEKIITEWTSQRSEHDAARELQSHGVAAAVCASNKDVAEDPHLIARNAFVRLNHPEVGAQQHIGIPWQMSGTPCAVRAPAPCIGQHTDEVLTGVLGYSEAELTKLRDAGALE